MHLLSSHTVGQVDRVGVPWRRRRLGRESLAPWNEVALLGATDTDDA